MPVVRAERLPVKTYTVADGLLRDTVFKIKQDSRGFLWFCTPEGVSRFDGVGMTNFTAADGLPDSSVQDLLETKTGTIYFATGKGLARLNPRGLRASTENPLFTVFLPDRSNAQNIVTLFEDKDSQVWVGTSNGLYKLIESERGVTFEQVPLGEPLKSAGAAIAPPGPGEVYVDAILEDRHRTLWIGTYGNGLFRRSPDGGIRRFTTDDELSDNKITDLLEGRDGRLWMSLRSDASGGLCLLDEENTEHPVKKCYTTKDGLGSNWIRDMAETSDGQLWLATIPGLCRFQADGSSTVCKTYTAKNDVCDDIRSLAEDKDGNLWTGSSCGAKKIARYGFTTYKGEDGLFYDQASSVFENSTGELFAVAWPQSERVISRFDGEKFLPVKLRPGHQDYHGWGWQQTVWQDSRGAWWLPTGSALYRSPDNTRFEDLEHAAVTKIETGAKKSEIFRLFEDSRGDVWVITAGDNNELLRWERAANVWHNHTMQAGFSVSRVGSAFVEDNSGNLWIGASSDHGDSALVRYRDGEFRVLAEADGAPSGWVRDLFLDSRGRLWIASTVDGLWRLDEPNGDSFKFTKYTPANGLTSIATTSVTEDAFGRIYVGTWRGVDRLDLDTGQIENFTTADGLPASFVEIAYRDRHNDLWFGTHDGLAKLVPEPPRFRSPPNVFITEIRVSGVPQTVSVLGETAIPPMALDPDQRQVAIGFLGLGTNLGERLTYEYRFGASNWTQTNERSVDFANLAADKYSFEVRARSADGLYSPPATFAFNVAAPLWQRWWFLSLASLSIAALTYLIYKNRLNRFRELEKVRTRIATDLHDDIGANLTRISLLSEVAKRKVTNGAGTLLTSIAEIARESVASMNDIVWAISPDHDSLLDLTRRMRKHAEEVFVIRNIHLDFDAPTSDLKLSVGARRDLLLLFKEAVNNAAKHSACSRVSIELNCLSTKLLLRVTDDGIGFSTDRDGGDGQGLRSMRCRTESLSGILEIKSSAETGTSVHFEMPLKDANRV